VDVVQWLLMTVPTTSGPKVHHGIGLLNLVRVGGILIAIGIAGMVVIGIQIREAIVNPTIWVAEGFWFQMKEYVFMFTMIAGFVIVLYGLVSLQRKKAKRLGNAR
jgi:hypothetical protein